MPSASAALARNTPCPVCSARINGSTSTDRTNYWEVVPSNHLERALQMEADRMPGLLVSLGGFWMGSENELPAPSVHSMGAASLPQMGEDGE